jgi:hypothetical protein
MGYRQKLQQLLTVARFEGDAYSEARLTQELSDLDKRIVSTKIESSNPHRHLED